MSDDYLPEKGAYAWPLAEVTDKSRKSQAIIKLKRAWSLALSFLGGMRWLILNIVAIAIGITIAIVVWKATTEDLIIVETVIVPKSLEEKGFTGAAVGRKLLDELRTINAIATTTQQRAQFGGESAYASIAAMQVPSSGLSLQTIVVMVRNLWGKKDKRISGEVTVKASRESPTLASYLLSPGKEFGPTTYVLSLRIEPTGQIIKSFEAIDINDAIRSSSFALVEQLTPLVLASYLHSSGRLEDAEEVARRIIPGSDKRVAASIWNMRGLISLDRKKRWDAERLLNQAITSDPTFTFAYVNLARTYSERNRNREAVETLNKALTIDERNASAHNNLGVELLAEGRIEDAIKRYATAISIEPDNALYHANWGYALLVKGDYYGSIAKFRQSIELNSRRPFTLVCLGVALGRTGDRLGAFEMFQRALELNPKEIAAYVGWGDIYLYDNAYQSAAAMYSDAIALDGANGMAFNGWGNALFGQSDFAGAVEKYHKAIKYQFHYASTYFELGRAYLQTGNTNDSIDSLRVAAQLDPNNAAFQRTLGDAFRLNGDVKSATVAYMRAAWLDPRMIGDIAPILKAMNSTPLPVP